MHVRRTMCAVLGAGMLLGLAGMSHAATLNGTPGDDEIVGTQRADFIRARAGDDTVRGRGGVDEVKAGPGDDVVHLGPGERVATSPGMLEYDAADGGAGNDVLKGAGDTDSLLDGRGDDVLRGGAGNDFLTATAGHDLLVGGTGRDEFFLGYPEDDSPPLAISTVRGGADQDTVHTLDDGRPDEIDCGSGTDVVHYAGKRDPLDTLVDCERVRENSAR